MPVRFGPEIQALPRAGGLRAPAASGPAATAPVDRSELRRAYRPDEEALVEERLDQARLDAGALGEATATARALVKQVRAHKPSGIDAFLHAYDLGSDEGIAMMCLAEALLRIPDAHTADELIADKLAGPDWSEKLGASDSSFVNAATFSLLLTGKVLEGANDRSDNWRGALGRAVGRLGEPVVRTAVREAMKILGRNFVFGRTIDEALKRAAPERARGLSHSFDMLGEAAQTFEDAERYAAAYRGALERIAAEAEGGFRKSPGISVKLTALHPRYEYTHAAEAMAAILPVVRELALQAAKADVHFTIDAEEADRLELQMDMFEALLADDTLFEGGWSGFGIAIQAYQKRAVPLVRLGRASGAGARAQADGPSGQGRLLGHRGQGRAGRGTARLSGVHAQGRDRRVVPRLREGHCSKRATCFFPRSRPTTPPPSARSRRWPRAARSNSSACTAWARRFTRSLGGSRKRLATRRPRCGSTRRSGATRNCSHTSSGGCSRTAPIRASSTASPTSMSRSRSWSRTRSQSSLRWSQSATRRSFCRARSSGRNGATAPESICPTPWCVSRCWSG